jgi:hypothetical protein
VESNSPDNGTLALGAADSIASGPSLNAPLANENGQLGANALHGTMKIVVSGGSGLIGSKLVPTLRERGHEAVAAYPKSGVNT